MSSKGPFLSLLTVLTIAGSIAGLVFGVVYKTIIYPGRRTTTREMAYLSFVSDIFFSIIRCLVLPVFLASLVCGIGNLRLANVSTIAVRGLVYAITSLILAILCAVISMLIIKPGAAAFADADADPHEYHFDSNLMETAFSLIRQMFPENLLHLDALSTQTVIKYHNNTPAQIIEADKETKEMVAHMNLLGMTVFAIIIGTVISAFKLTYPLIVLDEVRFLVLRITGWVSWLSPISVVSVGACVIMIADDWKVTFVTLGYYSASISFALVVHGFIVLPLLCYIITKRNPYQVVGAMFESLITAFVTASSSATLGMTLINLQNCEIMDYRITQFIIPIAVTLNMDGTVLYETATAIFVAQFRGYSLSLLNIITICVSAGIAVNGISGVPRAGPYMSIMILDLAGLPTGDMPLLFTADWFLDRVRTTINVLSDAYGTAIISHLSRKDLLEIDADDDTDSQIWLSQPISRTNIRNTIYGQRSSA